MGIFPMSVANNIYWLKNCPNLSSAPCIGNRSPVRGLLGRVRKNQCCGSALISMRIQIQHFISMWIRIQGATNADLDPDPFKLDFDMKNILICLNMSQNIPSYCRYIRQVERLEIIFFLFWSIFLLLEDGSGSAFPIRTDLDSGKPNQCGSGSGILEKHEYLVIFLVLTLLFLVLLTLLNAATWSEIEQRTILDLHFIRRR